MKKRFQLIALLAVALLGACSGGKDKVAVEQVDEKPRVKLADVKARPVEQIHEYTATVEAEVKNNIAPSSPVRIDRILVEVGDRVSKGQKLVSMDEANLKQTKFQLDNQEIEFKRMDELYKVGGASKPECQIRMGCSQDGAGHKRNGLPQSAGEYCVAQPDKRGCNCPKL